MDSPAHVGRASDYRRFIKPIGLVVALVVGLLLGPDLVWAWWLDMEPPTRRALAVGFLNAVLIGYGFVLTLACVGAVVALIRLLTFRRARRPVGSSAKVLLLCVTSLLSLAVVEAGTWALDVWQRGVSRSGSTERTKSAGLAAAPETNDPNRDLVLLVIGESSAEGQPFEAWTSIGHMVAWQLERAHPGRRVRVVMKARGGVSLTYTLQGLEDVTERPDLVLLYAGHNEFQARWGWTRVVDHYHEDFKTRSRETLIDRVGDWTPVFRLVRDAFEQQMVDYDPPPRAIRAAVDRPVCSAETRASIRDLFESQLETIARWCEQVGALPVFFVPTGNDVDFDPDRSVLSPDTTRPERERFARDLKAVRSSEEDNLEAALGGYRGLILRQPSFAEAHYRLAKLLQQSGRIDEAREEYVRARDCDGLPMRCPSEFQEAYRNVAKRHDVVLVEASAVLEKLSPSGLLDANVFHDGQHPTFRGYLALAQDVVDQLKSRARMGLDAESATLIDPDLCASHFKLDAPKWAAVCQRSALIWSTLAKLRYDGDQRKVQAARFRVAAERIQAGESLEALKVPGLGVHPPGFP